MNNLLVDLWNGNLCPVENCGANDPEIENLVRLIEKNRDKLDKALDETQKKAFLKYSQCMDEYLCVITEHAFCDGFSLACRLLTKALSAE